MDVQKRLILQSVYCIGDNETVVKGLVPLKIHYVSVIAVYKDGIEERGSAEYMHTGMSFH